MSKNQLISVTVLILLTTFGGYLFLRQSASPISSVEQINSPTLPQTPAMATNTQALTTVNPSASPQDELTPDMARLLKLMNDCRVEMINFSDSYGGPSKSVNAVILKDGTSFDNPSVISASDVLILGATIRALKDKCPIRTITRLLDR
jgi:hypothetical protein